MINRMIVLCGLISAGMMSEASELKASYKSTINSLDAVLALDTLDLEAKKYKNFRTVRDPYVENIVQKFHNKEIRILDPKIFEKSWEELTPEDRKGVLLETFPSRQGLDEMQMSGSGQFGGQGLDEIAFKIKDRFKVNSIVVFDLREEPHAYLNDAALPFSLYGEADAFSVGSDWSQLEAVETMLVNAVAQKSKVFLHSIKGVRDGLVTETKIHNMPVNSVYREDKLVRDKGMGYIRIGITDHRQAKEADLDEVRRYRDAIPANAVWKHFKCRGGVGRTTTGMVLFDMMRNHKRANLSFVDIVMRQHFIGGSNLLAPLNLDEAKEWKAAHAFARAKMIWNFYTYLQETDADGRIYYRQWLQARQLNHSLAVKNT